MPPICVRSSRAQSVIGGRVSLCISNGFGILQKFFTSVRVDLFARMVRWFLRHKKTLLTLGWVLLFLLLVNYVVMPLYVHQGRTLIVPDVTGVPFEEAKSLLASKDLVAVEADTRSDPKMPIGSVLGQNPAPEAVVKSGRHIYLVVSGGEALVSVPILRGRSSRDAKFALERYGLALGTTAYAVSEAYPENTIVYQSVQEGTKVPRGTAVGIIVSRGRAIEQAAVPDVVGRSVSEAERLLTSQGLRLGNVAYQISASLVPNTVVDQFPRAGDSVAYGRAVDLFVVKAGMPKEEVGPPSH